MSKGKEWEVCMRRNGRAMMKVNVSPVIMDKDECVSILYWHLGHKSKHDILTMKKKEIKDALKIGARYLSYFGHLEDAPPNREQAISDNGIHGDSWCLETWDACELKIDLVFPEFNFIGDRNES